MKQPVWCQSPTWEQEPVPDITSPQQEPRVCVVMGHPPSPSETFIRAHIERLPNVVGVAYGHLPILNDRPLRSSALVARATRKAVRLVRGLSWEAEVTKGYLKAYRHCRPDAVLVEYGDNAVWLREACRRAQIPLIAHFHGYDASRRDCLTEMEIFYPLLFRDAAAIIAVSRAMRSQLISLGARPEKVHWNPYGVDCNEFDGGNAVAAPPVFLAVGRFTEKKAPHLTLRAFAQVHQAQPAARLRMIGFGPMRDSCERLACELGIADSVTFLGACSPAVVQQEMSSARCFVQHSVEAANGDAEGTPVAILEAGASALPVISTRHGGIVDVVVEEQTGLLVDEGDVSGMARAMLRIARDPDLAGQLGRAARNRIVAEFSMEHSIGRLSAIIKNCIGERPIVNRNELLN